MNLLNKYQNLLYVLFFAIFFIAFFQFIRTDIIDAYANINLYMNFDFGVFKRAFAGELYNLINSCFFNNELARDTYLLTIHNCLIYIFILGVSVIFYICLKFKRISSVWIVLIFADFISSYFVKNLISLNGYLDAYVIACMVFTLICCIKNYYLLASLLAMFASLIHEETLFFIIPIFFVDFLWNSKQRKRILCSFSLPLIVCLAIAYIPIPLDKYNLFFMDGTIPKSHIDTLVTQFSEQQKDLALLINKQINEIVGHYDNVIFAYIYLTFPSVLLIVYLFMKISKYRSESSVKLLFTFLISFIPEVLLLIATDLWRLVGFLNFTIWSVLVLIICKTDICVNKYKITINEFFFRIIMLLFILFYFMLPNITLSIKEGSVGGPINSSFYSKYLSNLFPYKFAENFIDFYAFRNGDKDVIKYVSDGNNVIQCSKSGEMIDLPQMSYGRKLVNIEIDLGSYLPTNKYPKIQIGNIIMPLTNKNRNTFEIDIPRQIALAYRFFFYIECLPYDVDWNIQKIEILPIEEISN